MFFTSEKLLDTFVRLDGCKALGFLTTATNTTSDSVFPLRVLHVPHPCMMKFGDVLVAPGGSKILLMDTPQDSALHASFRAAYITSYFSWTRKTQTIDPVARVPRDTGDQDMGVLYVYFENPTNTAFERMIETRYQFYTGQDVKVGDTVGGKLVKTVVQKMGVNFVSAE